MTLSPSDLALYAAAVFALFLTPGPVWMALTARTLAGGVRAAWPLAAGVVIGDALWSLLALLGLAWVISSYAGAMTALRLVAAVVFVWLGIVVIRNAGRAIGADSRLTRPGVWAGFFAGLAAILGNPKAILFYMGVLPGFFDLSRVTAADIAVIVFISMIVPLLCNLAVALLVDRAKRRLSSPAALRRTNLVAGALLIAVGLAIPVW
ncbi:LysE family translocator [Rhodosalinus halophilus]|uniref:LysE family translocator n=1 Tax=Rhodosalinus halophilus TaxID=2259333 RepID=A0A365U798_9RHOB|nr:LysE family translocator [Rhodosalinus halophilus]RBI84603.1 LysE family translocator [Rhodosalinus halophilus]